jgi:hypothetical protein
MFCYKITFQPEGNLNHYPAYYYVNAENAKDACESAESKVKKNVAFKKFEITNCEMVGVAL